MGVNFCGKHFTIYIKPLCCKPRTNTMFYVNYTLIKLGWGEERKPLGNDTFCFCAFFISWDYSNMINMKKKSQQQNTSLQERNNWDPIFMPGWMTCPLRWDFFSPSNHIFPVVKLKAWSTPCLLSHHVGGMTLRRSQEAGFRMLFLTLVSVVYFHVCKVRRLDFISVKSS